jgi:predicted SAM-dependent methyltransferase
MMLHFGCGAKRLPPPWVNCDGQSGADRVVNFIDPWEIAAGSVEWIYCCHAIEHVEFDTLPAMFGRWHKLMEPGGKVTLATIDIDGIYQNRYKAGVRAASWVSALYGDSWGLDRPFAKHCCAFDAMLLSNLLMDAGFHSVRHWEPSEYPEIAALHDCATTDRDVSLLLEAVA